MSGNSLTGSLPSTTVALSNALVDLSLSYNLLSGSIPQFIQENYWNSLDLSHNRLTGTLMSSFNSTSSSSTLSLNNNRLSGFIPTKIHDMINIDILEGNYFDCKYDRSDLPSNDKNQDTYECTDATTGAAVWSIVANSDWNASTGSKAIANKPAIPIEIQSAASDETTALTTGTGKVTFRVPSAFTLTGVRASLTTAQASGSILTVDINQNGSSVLSTLLTIDNTEKTSVTAATAAVISTSAITDDAEITIDIDQIGDGTATGLKITLIGAR
jgi:hypothetical protein